MRDGSAWLSAWPSTPLSHSRQGELWRALDTGWNAAQGVRETDLPRAAASTNPHDVYQAFVTLALLDPRRALARLLRDDAGALFRAYNTEQLLDLALAR